MVDDTYYISNHEAALAVVATAMKKSRLRLDTLVINSIMGAILFSAGGMLHLLVQAQNPALMDNGYEGIVHLGQGLVYSLGLFYVVTMGMELFNSNVLFFSVGFLRGAVTLMDLLINWFISFFVNLGTTILIVYVFLFLSGVIRTEAYVTGSIAIAEEKIQFSFIQTFLKGICCNFFVSLAIYLQITAKPIHVKFLLILLPVFTFVAMGFNHVVADMFLIPCGIFNNCSYGWGRYFWKLCLPATLGNIVGGSFFGIMIPWYLHLVVIERDMKELNLPTYEQRDEQPLLNMDSRVIRVKTPETGYTPQSSSISSSASSTGDEKLSPGDLDPVEYNPDAGLDPTLSRSRTTQSSSRSSTTSSKRKIRSPKGVFPVADMGPPLKRERTIASAYSGDDSDRHNRSIHSDGIIDDTLRLIKTHTLGSQHKENDSAISDPHSNENDEEYEAEDTATAAKNPYNPDRETMSGVVKQVLKKVRTRRQSDIESIIEGDNSQVYNSSQQSSPQQQRRTSEESSSSKLWRQLSFGGGGNNPTEIHRRLSAAKITEAASRLSNDISGIHHDTISQGFHENSKRASGQSIRSKHRVRMPQKKRKSSKKPTRYPQNISSSSVTPTRSTNEIPVGTSSGSASETELDNIREADDEDVRSIDSNALQGYQSAQY